MPGTNVLLIGPPGSGKTHSIRTLIDAGLEVFCLFTEPGMEVLGDTDIDKLHWHYVPPSQPSWDAMIDNATKVNSFDAGALQKMAGMNKREYAQFVDVLKVCNNFTCQRCGKEFGPIDKFDTNRAFVFDSLSGLNIMLLDLAVGGKPIRTQPDWGVAIDTEEKFLNRLALGMRAHFVLISHVDRQVDQVLGGIKLFPAALGQKLPPLVSRFFSDVIFTEVEGDKFIWSTSHAGLDPKTRNLPIAKSLPPNFVPILENWKKFGGVVSIPTEKVTENV